MSEYSTTLSNATERNAYFLIKRGDVNYRCKGSGLYEKVNDLDKVVVQRNGSLGTTIPAGILDSDTLVCMDGNKTRKISGDRVKELFQPPPPLGPVLTQLDNVVVNPGDTVETKPANSEITVEVETNSASDHLTKSYNWNIRDGNGSDATFVSSSGARIAVINVGTTGAAFITCTIQAQGSAEGSIDSATIQVMPV